jgi:Kef-type K+ transport system membrane component KefB
LLLLSIVLLTAKYAGYLSVKIGQPMVFGKIALGLILGPTILDIINWHIGGFYFFGGMEHGAAIAHGAEAMAHQVANGGPIGGYTGETLLHTFKDMAEIGVLLLMFMAGLETDLQQMMKVGKVALWAAIGGVVAPLLAGFGSGIAFKGLGLELDIYECLFIGTILTATSVSISAQTLMELKRLKSKEGMTILGAAVIDDVVGIIVLSFVIAFKPAGPGGAAAPQKLLDWIMMGVEQAGVSGGAESAIRISLLIIMMALFFVVAVSAEKWFIRPVVKAFDRMPITQGLLAGVLLVGFVYAWAAEWIGNVAAITGTYLAGVLLARSELAHQIEERLHTITYSLFVPIFFVSIGIEANARPIFSPLAHLGSMTRTEWLVLIFTLLIVAVAVLTKVIGCLVGARMAGFDAKSSLRVGVGMISRGEVGIIVALVGLNAGIIDTEVFSMMILMVLVTTLVTPIWLKVVFKGDDGGGSGDKPEEALEPTGSG